MFVQHRLMIRQRVTKNLGLNRSADKGKIYKYIEDVLRIKVKYCSRGRSKRKGKYGVVHIGKNPLPIRAFNLDNAYIDSTGRVRVVKTGLQPYCIACERKYRRGRLNKWLAIYSKMTDEEVRVAYKKNYGPTTRCSRCNKDKKPEKFLISRRMDKGLHNVCIECSKSYSESVGDRWITYSPDGRNSVSVKGERCKVCGSKKLLHKDHIWPIAKGGTDFSQNIQILCEKHNLSKSDLIQGVRSIGDVKDEMICERYRGLLYRARMRKWSIDRFELEISKSVRKLLKSKEKMSDKQLKNFFVKEKERNNRKHSINRAVRKFRKYADTAVLDISNYISKFSR